MKILEHFKVVNRHGNESEYTSRTFHPPKPAAYLHLVRIVGSGTTREYKPESI